MNIIKQQTLESTLKKWCNLNLATGMCYGGQKDTPITKNYNQNRKGTLIYQDGTACSASFVFNDIYILDDNTYIVYTDAGGASHTGGNIELADIEPYHCKNLCEVLDKLLEYNGHDPNTTGKKFAFVIRDNMIKLDEKCVQIIHRLKFPIFSKCDDNDESLINAIECIIENKN